jgi:malate dehydrogenase (oxaloacetate-decarboxylating)(NADP+)
MRKPVHVLPLGSEVKDIVNMTAIAVVDAQQAGRRVEGRQDEVQAVLSPS